MMYMHLSPYARVFLWFRWRYALVGGRDGTRTCAGFYEEVQMSMRPGEQPHWRGLASLTN